MLVKLNAQENYARRKEIESPFRVNTGQNACRSILFENNFTQIRFWVVNIKWKLNMFEFCEKLER